MIRVLIVEDQAILRESLARSVATSPIWPLFPQSPMPPRPWVSRSGSART